MTKLVYMDSVDHLNEAYDLLESFLKNKTDELSVQEAEIKFINNRWRVGVILVSGQHELEFD